MNLRMSLSSFLVGVAMIASVPACFRKDEVKPTPNAETSLKKETSQMDERLKKLTKEQFEVTQQCSTEPPFRNAYWNNKEPGIYVDIVDGTPLFSSLDKFDSGTGWPSFTKPIAKQEMKEIEDRSHGMSRTEVKSSKAGSHLGHVFDDGPGPDHKRYCINSASLRFIPVNELEKEGYGEFLKLFGKEKKGTNRETAVLAGGCFWGVEDLIRRIPGVVDTQVGYTGGTTTNPKYEEVKTGRTGHAESVQIVFDPSKITYAEILDHFFRLHNPTTLNQQGNDIGSQYRSAIFYESDAQKKIAEQKIKEWNESGKWKAPIVTQIVKADTFYAAEDYHQDYLIHHPNGYTCHYYREF